METLEIEDLYLHLSELPIPRSVRRRPNPSGMAAMLIFSVAIVVGAVIFGNLVATYLQVKFFGQDFAAKITAVGQIEMNGLNASRLVTIDVNVNGKSVIIQKKVSEWRRFNLQVGQPLIVRCLPQEPRRGPLIITLGDADWMNDLAYCLLVCLLLFLTYRGILVEHLLSLRDKRLAESGAIGLGRILKIKYYKGKVNSFTYEYLMPGSQAQMHKGKFGLVFAQNLEGVVAGQTIIVLIDADRPRISVPALAGKWMIRY